MKRTGASAATRQFDGLRAIALFKFGKATLLIVSAWGLHQLLRPELFAKLNGWTATLTDSYARRLLSRALDWIGSLAPAKINVFIAVYVAYTLLVLVEGTGLWLRKGWAEWMTVVATGSLVPFELWELLTRRGGHKFGIMVALALNLIIVGYLIALLERNARRA